MEYFMYWANYTCAAAAAAARTCAKPLSDLFSIVLFNYCVFIVIVYAVTVSHLYVYDYVHSISFWILLLMHSMLLINMKTLHSQEDEVNSFMSLDT